MRSSILLALIVCVAALADLTAGRTARCQADEPAKQFLEALRQRQYFDMAEAYLQRMQTHRSAPPDFVETILYQYGTTLLEAARNERDGEERERLLDRAQEKLGQFIAAHEDHELASAAADQMATLLMQRAGLKLATADDAANASAHDRLRKEAGQFYDRAEGLYQRRRDSIRASLEEMPKSIDPKKQAALLQQRGLLRADYVRLQLILAKIKYDKASIEKSRQKAYRKQLKEAADLFGDIAEKYRLRLLNGQYAVLYQGRCYHDMGDYEQALSLYGELLQEQDSSDGFRRLKTKALKRAMQCWLHESVNQLEMSIETGQQWVAEIRDNEESDPDWLEIRWLLGNALRRKATTEKHSRADTNRILGAARQQLRSISSNPGPHVREAKQLLAQWQMASGPREENATANKPDPQTIVEASEAGRAVLERVENSTVLLQLLQSQISNADDANRKAELRQQLAEAQQTIDTACPEAVGYFRRALELARDDASPDELNPIRDSLCRLYYVNDDLYEAAVLGQFIALRYPNYTGARQAAQIAMASYYKIYAEQADAGSSFATSRMIDLADHIVAQWPEAAEAEGALALLVSLMVQRGDLEQAITYLNKLPDDSRRRGEAELRTGQALWANYLAGTRAFEQANRDDAKLKDRSSLDQLRLRAQKMLTDGIQRVNGSTVDARRLRAVLSLAQIHLELDQPQKAIALLQDPQTGPQTFLDRNDARIAGDGFDEAIYRATLRAAIAVLPSANDPGAAMAEAIAVMDKLKKRVGGTPEGNRRVIGIYVALARDLQRQMQASAPSARQSLSAGLQTFLTQVAEQAAELNVLYWVAETFSSLGKGVSDNRAAPSAEARQLYQNAAAAYQKILEKEKAGELPIDPSMLAHVQSRLAATWQRLGKYESAIDLFEMVLRTNDKRLDVQLDAARAYQSWGKTGEVAYLDRAVMGGRPDEKTRKNTIWGWAKMANTLASLMYRGPEYKQKYNDAFHEARLNIASARFQQAKLQSGSKRKASLQRAKTAIVVTHTLYPEMGGEAWRPQYDQLLRQIQKTLGEKTGGLKAL